MQDIGLSILSEATRDAGTSAWIWLLDIEVDDQNTLYLTDNPEAFVFDGRTYEPFPFTFDPMQQKGDGSLPLTAFTFGGQGRLFMSFLESNTIVNRRVVARLIPTIDIQDPAAVPTQAYRIQDVQAGWKSVTLNIGFPSYGDRQGPARTASRNMCQHRYRDPRTCQYAGELPTCARNRQDCLAHENLSNFGAYPGTQRTNL